MRGQALYPLLALVLALFALGCGSGSSNENGGGSLYGSTPQKAEPEVEENTEPVAAQPDRLVEIATDYGTMTAKLYNSTPKHRDNFIKLAEEGFYDGTLFHRIISGFMIQGGDPDSKTAEPGQRLGGGGPGYTVPAEIRRGLIHKRGALCAARLGDGANPRRESSGSQFYIVHGNVYTPENFSAFEMQRQYTQQEKDAYFSLGGTPQLDGQYTVFGEVIEGFEVIDAIANLRRDPTDRPLEDVAMKVRVLPLEAE